MANDSQQMTKDRIKKYLDDPRTPLKLELVMLFREAQAAGRILYPDEAMVELEKSVRKRLNIDDESWKSSGQKYSPKERTTATKFWRDIYYAAVDYHFDFYRGLANQGGRPSKQEEFLETERRKQSGLSNGALAKMYGISRSAVIKRRKKIKALGLQVPSVTPPVIS